MTITRIASSAAALAGLAASAWAVPPAALDRGAHDPGAAETLLRAFRLPLAPAPRAANSLDLTGAFGAVSRGGAGADVPFSTLDTGFESLAPLPANLVGQQDVVTWGGASASVTGRCVFGPATAKLAPPHYGAVTDSIAGNGTMKLRGLVQPAFGPNTFFGRWARMEIFRVNGATPATSQRMIFRPDGLCPLRVSHDVFLTSIDSMWTSEPTYVTGSLVTARLLWGGQNATPDLGLPIGPIPDFYTLDPGCADSPDCIFITYFRPCRTPATYRSGAPYPGGPDHFVPAPVGAWFTIIHEWTDNEVMRHAIDLHDGHGEFVIYEAFAYGWRAERIDRMAFAGGFETEGDACYIDNLHVEGVAYSPCPYAFGDTNEDGLIDFGDLNTVLAWFGQSVTPPQVGLPNPDVNHDGVVNFADLNVVLSNYGAAC